jgi:hydroxyacylglutathione hydrolase
MLVFPGDTLFAMGCGRLFEGTAGDMHVALQKLAALPAETQVYCAHEYTLGNARFALTVDPHNSELRHRAGQVEQARAAGEATVPTTIALERATNPFMRATSVEALAALRTGKDNFRS